jgi:Domain of unknown function (DUF6265)
MLSRVFPPVRGTLSVLIAALAVVTAGAQTVHLPDANPAPTAPAETGAPGAEALAALAWLEGCWRGRVNQREFNERWQPPGSGLMIGASHTVFQGRTQDYEDLRLEGRPDGVYYVVAVSGQREIAYRLVASTVDTEGGRKDELFTFENPAQDFPQKIIYRRGAEGWLYATVEGKVGAKPRQVIYPMRRIGCESGEPIRR